VQNNRAVDGSSRPSASGYADSVAGSGFHPLVADPSTRHSPDTSGADNVARRLSPPTRTGCRPTALSCWASRLLRSTVYAYGGDARLSTAAPGRFIHNFCAGVDLSDQPH